MSLLAELNPAPVWTFFEEICKIPRLSRNEEKIRKYLLSFAKKHRLESKEDSVGNILIVRSACPGMENRKTVVLQSHMDMVGEKNSDYHHNWSSDPIKPLIEGGWVTAGVTTLGADDGIGIAAQLAILADKTLKAGRIEALFTVDEETGMTGATNLNPGFFSGRILLNLDSEDEGILFIGCAGGMDTVGTLKYDPVSVSRELSAFEISISGLHGGHSGDEIHKGYANAIKLMNRLLRTLSNQYDISISRFDGGNLRNAIPREAFSEILFDESLADQIRRTVDFIQTDMSAEFGSVEKEMKITIKVVESPALSLDKKTQTRLLDAITCCPHGVIAWSAEMEDLVETSTNLASIRFSDDDTIKIVTTQRSSLASAKADAAATVASCLKLAGAGVEHSDGYPGWKPSLRSEILRITRESYLRLFGKEPMVRAIHAGLECGLIYEKFEGIDMISFGPTIRGAHTPDEKIEIKTVQMFWDLLTEVLRNIPEA
ncbi:MAG: aminoacyl-histidine dipeptidase [Bacteroidales bacterium]|nr:aminoacyl-histidine dipeptidase [Bacteroidales bacterium]